MTRKLALKNKKGVRAISRTQSGQKEFDKFYSNSNYFLSQNFERRALNVSNPDKIRVVNIRDVFIRVVNLTQPVVIFKVLSDVVAQPLIPLGQG